MNKARIVLTAVALFAVIGGALAFKAMRTPFRVFTTTTIVNTFGTNYTLAGGASFCYYKPNAFFTVAPNGVQAQDQLSTTAPATLTLTLTRVGGAQTITIPNWCTVTALTTTRTTAVE